MTGLIENKIVYYKWRDRLTRGGYEMVMVDFGDG
jgi:hypothetical protein